MVSIEAFSTRPELVTDAVEIAWTEWGAHLAETEYERWRELAERDCQLHSPYSAGFVAVEAD